MRSFEPEFELLSARDLSAALELISSDQGWRPIAGGTDLMVLFNAGQMPYRKVMSIRDIDVLRGIQTTSGLVSIGSAVTYSEIRNSPILQAEFPLLCQAASWTGGIANQNRGTLGGNIANASPAADSAPVLLAYDAELELKSKRGSRFVPYAEFHLGYKQTDLREDELIISIRLPRHVRTLRQHGRKVGTRKAQAISKVSIAATAVVENDAILDIRIAMGSVAPVPLRCKQTEALLRGRRISLELQAQSQEALLAEISPISDIRSTGAYRARVSSNLLGEFLESLR